MTTAGVAVASPEADSLGRTRLLLPIHVAVSGVIVVASVGLLSLNLHTLDQSHDVIAIGCGLAVAALIAYVRVGLGQPWLSASIVYLSLFWMFHYGLVFTAALVPDVLVPFEDWEIAWLYWPNVRVAMILGVLGAAGFVFGIGLTVAGRSEAVGEVGADRTHDAALYAVGCLILLAGLTTSLVALARSGGFSVLAVGYDEFRSTILGPTALSSSIDVSQLGCVLAVCGAGGRRWILPMALWTAFAVLLLMLGLRNQALIPMVTLAVLLAHRGHHLRREVIAAAVVAVVVLIPAIKTFRSVGFGNRAQVDWSAASPLETFTELGGTLRAVKAYVDWIEEGDPYLLGASYWAPFDRQLLTRLLPDRARIAYDDDTRVPARQIYAREGAVGASSTGEAYYNFGPLGPAIFGAGLGLLFGLLERRAAASCHVCALLGVTMLIFCFNIRSDWLAVPARFAIGVTLVALCWMWSRGLLWKKPA